MSLEINKKQQLAHKLRRNKEERINTITSEHTSNSSSVRRLRPPRMPRKPRNTSQRKNLHDVINKSRSRSRKHTKNKLAHHSASSNKSSFKRLWQARKQNRGSFSQAQHRKNSNLVHMEDCGEEVSMFEPRSKRGSRGSVELPQSFESKSFKRFRKESLPDCRDKSQLILNRKVKLVEAHKNVFFDEFGDIETSTEERLNLKKLQKLLTIDVKEGGGQAVDGGGEGLYRFRGVGKGQGVSKHSFSAQKPKFHFYNTIDKPGRTNTSQKTRTTKYSSTTMDSAQKFTTPSKITQKSGLEETKSYFKKREKKDLEGFKSNTKKTKSFFKEKKTRIFNFHQGGYQSQTTTSKEPFFLCFDKDRQPGSMQTVEVPRKYQQSNQNCFDENFNVYSYKTDKTDPYTSQGLESDNGAPQKEERMMRDVYSLKIGEKLAKLTKKFKGLETIFSSRNKEKEERVFGMRRGSENMDPALKTTDSAGIHMKTSSFFVQNPGGGMKDSLVKDLVKNTRNKVYAKAKMETLMNRTADGLLEAGNPGKQRRKKKSRRSAVACLSSNKKLFQRELMQRRPAIGQNRAEKAILDKSLSRKSKKSKSKYGLSKRIFTSKSGKKTTGRLNSLVQSRNGQQKNRKSKKKRISVLHKLEVLKVNRVPQTPQQAKEAEKSAQESSERLQQVNSAFSELNILKDFIESDGMIFDLPEEKRAQGGQESRHKDHRLAEKNPRSLSPSSSSNSGIGLVLAPQTSILTKNGQAPFLMAKFNSKSKDMKAWYRPSVGECNRLRLKPLSVKNGNKCQFMFSSFDRTPKVVLSQYYLRDLRRYLKAGSQSKNAYFSKLFCQHFKKGFHSLGLLTDEEILAKDNSKILPKSEFSGFFSILNFLTFFREAAVEEDSCA